jgi:RNA polymerase sigma-70 factor (ECF subfamily)
MGRTVTCLTANLATRFSREYPMMTKLSVAELRTATVAQLVQATQSGQREAFGELFERFERQVFSIALRRIGDYGEAQEVCQDVFVQALQKIAQLREPERFGGWLRSIANRMAINRVVRRRPEVAAEPETLASACVDERTPLTAVLAIESQSQLRAGLARLRTLDRQTLVAFYVQGQSLLEMSDAFGAPLGTIKRRLHVARKRLAKSIETPVAV